MRSPFAGVSRKGTLGQPLVRETRWLEDGWHDGVLEDLDPAQAEETGKVTLVLRADNGASHRETMFLLTKDGRAFSWQFRALLGAILQSAESQRQFRELLADGETWRAVLECLRGMRLKFHLETRGGYRTRPTADEQFEAYLVDGGKIVAKAVQINEVHRRAQATGHSRAFRMFVGADALDEETKQHNLQAFALAAATIQQAASTESSDDSEFEGHK
jgi:hypothetical protein